MTNKHSNTDEDTTLKVDLGADTQEIDVPGEGGSRTRKEAIFNWLLRTRNLWMITEAYGDRVLEMVGASLFFKIAHLKSKWESSYALGHPALQLPRAARVRDSAFEELGRFLKTLPSDKM